MEEKRTIGVWIVATVLVPVLYVAACLALLTPTEPLVEPIKGNYIPRIVFQPLLEIDRRIRPTFWCDLSERGESWR